MNPATLADLAAVLAFGALALCVIVVGGSTLARDRANAEAARLDTFTTWAAWSCVLVALLAFTLRG